MANPLSCAPARHGVNRNRTNAQIGRWRKPRVLPCGTRTSRGQDEAPSIRPHLLTVESVTRSHRGLLAERGPIMQTYGQRRYSLDLVHDARSPAKNRIAFAQTGVCAQFGRANRRPRSCHRGDKVDCAHDDGRYGERQISQRSAPAPSRCPGRCP